MWHDGRSRDVILVRSTRFDRLAYPEGEVEVFEARQGEYRMCSPQCPRVCLNDNDSGLVLSAECRGVQNGPAHCGYSNSETDSYIPIAGKSTTLSPATRTLAN